jgi:hypothetical protein
MDIQPIHNAGLINRNELLEHKRPRNTENWKPRTEQLK